MSVVRLTLAVGIAAYVWALPLSYILSDMRLWKMWEWAAVPAVTAAAISAAWAVRNRAAPLTRKAAIAIAIVSFLVTTLSFALYTYNEFWPGVTFVVLSFAWLFWYPALAAAITVSPVERVRRWHAA